MYKENEKHLQRWTAKIIQSEIKLNLDKLLVQLYTVSNITYRNNTHTQHSLVVVLKWKFKTYCVCLYVYVCNAVENIS